MNTPRIITLIAWAACSLSLVGVVLAAGTPAVDWQVMAGGGGHVENGTYALDGTIGQVCVADVTHGTYRVQAGFWPGGGIHVVYLPTILRDAL